MKKLISILTLLIGFITLQGQGDTNSVYHDDPPIDIGGGGSSAFDGDRAIKSLPSIGVNYGGTTTSEFLDNVYFADQNATISINGSVIFEVGTSNSVVVSGSTTLNDETSLSLGRVDSIYPGTITEILSFGAATSYSTSVTFYPKQSDANSLESRYRAYQTGVVSGTINSGIKYCRSVYPFLWGTSASDLSAGGTGAYTGLTKYIQSAGNKSVTWGAADDVYLFFAYPASYGDLSSIIDNNGFDVTSAFTKYAVSVGSTGLDEDWSESYNIYKLNTLTIITAVTYQFNF